MRWYQRALPTIGSVLPSIEKAAAEVAAIDGVNGVFAWGSLAENIADKTSSIKDIDILVTCDFDSGDLLAIEKGPTGPFAIKTSELEEEGFNPLAVAFTKKFVKSAGFRVDYWAISKDDKLLHWGPVTDSVEEFKELRKDAETKVSEKLKLERKNLHKASATQRQNWLDQYTEAIRNCVASGPLGWYMASASSEEILCNAIKLS
tara:strand:+ start:92944 stop:93555 length:612 start_codon:yes stop_codon:yes gene_type:complete